MSLSLNAAVRGALRAALPALLITLGGCTLLPSPGPPLTRYDLLPPAGPGLALPAGEQVLMLELPDSVAGLEGDAMRYRRSQQTLDTFATGRWSAPPARLLVEAAQTALERSGRFRAVVVEPSQIAPDLRLHLALTQMEKDYRRGDGGIARVAVRFRLQEAASGRLLVAGVLDESAPGRAEGPEAFAEAAGVATRRLLDALDHTIAGALEDASAEGP